MFHSKVLLPQYERHVGPGTILEQKFLDSTKHFFP